MQLEGSWYVSSLIEAGIADKVTVVAFPGVREQKAKQGALVTRISSGFYITRRAWDNPEKESWQSALWRHIRKRISYKILGWKWNYHL